MGKIFFIILAIIFLSSGIGVLTNTFPLDPQELGVLHGADVTLVGCTCVNQFGNPVSCDAPVIAHILCQ
jgi:hypothetical protein